MSEATDCPICDGRAGRLAFPYGTIWDGRKFEYRECESCGTVFVQPTPTDNDFQRIYGRDSYHGQFYEDSTPEPFLEQLKHVQSHLSKSVSMLDFGCGNGDFLIAMRNAGFRCDGVELHRSAVEFAASRSGAAVKTLEDLEASGRRYGVIHLGDVLEHVPRPYELMRRLERLLSAGGRFWVEGPLEQNASAVFYAARAFGFAKRICAAKITGSDPPYHLFRVAARVQRDFFEKRLGYNVLIYKTWETGWPYTFPEGERLLSASSPANFLKLLIAAFSRAISPMANAAGVPVGNRFSTVLDPNIASGA